MSADSNEKAGLDTNHDVLLPLLRKPRPLRPGSRVRVIAPSSPFDPNRLQEGLRTLEDLGLVPLVADRIFEVDGYLAGSDSARSTEVVEAMTACDSDAVIPVRGGYGAGRLLPILETHVNCIVPMLWMGFSDITALHLFFLSTGCLSTLHGPNVVSMGRLDAVSRQRLEAALFGRDWEGTFCYNGLRGIIGGHAEGHIVAGNLAVLTSLLGTRYAPCLDNAILVLEDINEPAYRIDRMLTQLTLQPGFDRVAGVVFGDIQVPTELENLLKGTITRFAERFGRPVATGFPIGHGSRNAPVPEGVTAVLDADRGVLQVTQDPFDRG